MCVYYHMVIVRPNATTSAGHLLGKPTLPGLVS